MKSRVLTALPAFIAAYGGVMVYLVASDERQEFGIGALAAAIVVGWGLLALGRAFIGSMPVVGVVLMSGWILAVMAVGAGLTALFLWVGLRLPGWLTNGTISDENKEVAKVLLGAATAFAAVLFTDDLDKGEGELWPSTKTKAALGDKFSPDSGTHEYDALHEDHVRKWDTADRIGPVTGWGFTARVKRAQILGKS